METLSQTKEPMKMMPDAEGPMESKAKEIPTSIMEQENEKADNLTLQYNSYGSFIFSVPGDKQPTSSNTWDIIQAGCFIIPGDQRMIASSVNKHTFHADCGKLFGGKSHTLSPQNGQPIQDIKSQRSGTLIKIKRFVCKECQAAFTYPSGLKRHLVMHTTERPYICRECGDTFAVTSYLKRHMQTHKDKRPYACQLCSASFNRSESLKKHLRIHTGERPYVCDDCGAAFVQSSNLTAHQRIHSGEKPYTCSLCNMSFSRSDVLKNHLRIHTGERPHACHLCNISFSRSDVLKKHIQSHLGLKPYICKECGDAFSENRTLKKHSKVHSSH